jgi:hypothetical protein
MGFPSVGPAEQREGRCRDHLEARRRADELNGNFVLAGTTEALISENFKWQTRLQRDSEMRKADIPLAENRVEAKNLNKVFGTHHIYQYLDRCAELGAPAKANKEIALLSALCGARVRAGGLASCRITHAGASSTTEIRADA